MLLQQLLQRNQQNVRQVYLEEKRKKRILNDHYFKRRKPSDLKSNQHTFKYSPSNLLHHQVTQPNFITGNQSRQQTKNQSSLNIIRDKFVINDFKIQRIESGHRLNNKNSRSQSRQSERKFKLHSAQEKLYKTNLSFYKPNHTNTESFVQRKITTAGITLNKSPRFNSFEKRIFQLPDSFTLKASLIPFNRPYSTLIKYDEKLQSGRQESIHSRRKMRRQDQMMKSRKARSQQTFYSNEENFSQPKSKLSFLKESEQVPLEKQQTLHIEVEKISLQQKSLKKNEYVNVFYEYRKSKAKIQKQDLYTPWKKHQKDNKRSVDLTELIQLHHY